MAADQAQSGYALRITFAFDGPALTLKSVQRVAMRVPAAPPPPPEGDRIGYWLEVRDAASRLLYHRAVHDPLRRETESYGDGKGAPLRRHTRAERQGEFELIVPDLPEAATFRLHGPKEALSEQPLTDAEGHRVVTPSVPLREHSFASLRSLARSGKPGGQR